MGVSVCGLDLKNSLLNREEGNIESTTTEIEDEDVFFFILLSIETVSDSGSSGFVDDSEDVDT
jgi:hypothetical protein